MLRLNIGDAPPEVSGDESPQVGDVYRKAGGPPGYWVVVSVCPNADVYVLAFNRDGYVTGAQRYMANYLTRNDHRRVGRLKTAFDFDVEWF